ncbi:hypothetical protein SI65_06773 [Aspergillus cristatus]|uniref:Uncharacterized protein n=1 Tax=Aspergillus cristatus TaxID=573508 RepID=A0A1E3BAK1_ASPCR|nr:hypothetical protein SI65_06773 [Aspergillus cristatus]
MAFIKLAKIVNGLLEIWGYLKKPLNIIGYLVFAVALDVKKFVVYLYKKPEDVCAKFFWMVLNMFWTSSQVFTIFTIADICPGWGEPGDNKFLCLTASLMLAVELIRLLMRSVKREKNLQRESEERQRFMNSNENADEEGYELSDTVRNV